MARRFRMLGTASGPQGTLESGAVYSTADCSEALVAQFVAARAAVWLDEPAAVPPPQAAEPVEIETAEGPAPETAAAPAPRKRGRPRKAAR